MMQERAFKSFDGTELYMKNDIPTSPKGAVLIVHGLCEHQGRYDYVAARLNAAGYSVYRFDHRGHGRSQGKRVYYGSFTEIADDVNEAVKIMLAECKGLPAFVLGHSMGGFATTLFASRYPGVVQGIMLSGALTRYNSPIMGDLPIQADPESYIPNQLGDGVCSDPAVGADYAADPYVEKQISIGLCNCIGEGVSWLKQNAGQFTYPALIMHGADDGLVAEKDSRDLFGEIASKDKGLIIYPKMQHEILNEFEKDVVIADMLRWLQKHV